MVQHRHSIGHGHAELQKGSIPKKDTFLSAGCPNLDGFLQGGFPTKMITELCGEAGSGKTQLALQLLLQAQLPEENGGLGGNVCFISTNGMSISSRLHQLSEEFPARYKRHTGSLCPKSPTELLNGILVEKCIDLAQYIEVIQDKLPTLFVARGIKLVVIDSIASILRGEMVGTMESITLRSHFMMSSANWLRSLAHDHNAAVIVVNQMTGKITEGNGVELMGTTYNRQNRNVAPALGLTWTACVNQRIRLSKGTCNHSVLVVMHSVDDLGPCVKSRRVDQPVRWLEVEFSPYLPHQVIAFEICNDGVNAT